MNKTKENLVFNEKNKVKYKLCPVCELNYIHEDEDMCELCKHDSSSTSIVDLIEKQEQNNQSKLEKFSEKNKEYHSFLALRYNVPNKG